MLLAPLQADRSMRETTACARVSDRLRRSADGVNSSRELGAETEAEWRALRSIASRNGPIGLCQAESFGNFFLARIIHERFCCNRRSVATFFVSRRS
jgi:hypothetical protein